MQSFAQHLTAAFTTWSPSLSPCHARCQPRSRAQALCMLPLSGNRALKEKLCDVIWVLMHLLQDTASLLPFSLSRSHQVAIP